ncbi:MAG: ribosome small subunit-dependent GTPase A [Candidatus Latescibacterota bacterium]|nr:ribosome small subunit-dependent GTPase A [Candidatus Latescibacterota bacterium]
MNALLPENSSNSFVGRVLRVSGQLCLVEKDGKIFQYKLRGRLKAGHRLFKSPVVAGDWVDVKLSGGGEEGVIERVRPRMSHFTRASSGRKSYDQIILANVDQLLVVVSIRQPQFRPGFVDRAIVSAHCGKLNPRIIINKTDLIDPESLENETRIYRDLNYPVHYTSVKNKTGIDQIIDELKGLVTAVVGQSGVGKSSLLNCIDPKLNLKTAEIMAQHDRGRHTTTAVQLYRLDNGSYLADTPGVKHLQLSGIERNELAFYFSEMSPLAEKCKFRNCSHLNEPECAIIMGLKNGSISESRYSSYVGIMEDLSNE